MKLYQLGVRGPFAELEGTRTIYSQRVFRSREEAEEYSSEFEEKCCRPFHDQDMLYLSSVSQVQVVELELKEKEDKENKMTIHMKRLLRAVKEEINSEKEKGSGEYFPAYAAGKQNGIRQALVAVVHDGGITEEEALRLLQEKFPE